MEMNPFTLDAAGNPFPLDMRGELDDTAAFKSAKKWYGVGVMVVGVVVLLVVMVVVMDVHV